MTNQHRLGHGHGPLDADHLAEIDRADPTPADVKVLGRALHFVGLAKHGTHSPNASRCPQHEHDAQAILAALAERGYGVGRGRDGALVARYRAALDKEHKGFTGHEAGNMKSLCSICALLGHTGEGE